MLKKNKYIGYAMLNTKYAQITSPRASTSVFTEIRHCDSMQMWY